MRKFYKHLGLTALVLASGLVTAHAQTTSPSSPDNKPYDAQLFRLAEILGAVHYLRALCGAGEGQRWRDQMRDLIDAEASTALRRARMVGRFNKGYRGFRRTYRNCTPPATRAISRFMREGADIAQTIIKNTR